MSVVQLSAYRPAAAPSTASDQISQSRRIAQTRMDDAVRIYRAVYGTPALIAQLGSQMDAERRLLARQAARGKLALAAPAKDRAE